MSSSKFSSCNHSLSSSTDPYQLIDLEELASLLCVGKRTIYRLKDEGKLPEPVKIRGSLRWRRVDIESWIAGGCKSKRRGIAAPTR